MNHTRPRIDDILTGFFADALEDQTGVARRRILAVEQRLRLCIEAEGDRMLTNEDYLILAAERAFDPDHAIARTMHAEDLLWVLTVFLLDPWRLGDPLALRVQAQLTDDLTNRIVYGGLVCIECMNHPLQHIREGLAMARKQVNRAQPQKRRRRTVPHRG
jgi:hypothetical protein